MSNRKSELYNELKARGGVPAKHYREYTAEELQELVSALPPGPRASKPDPGELPNARINSKLPEEVIRIDDDGRQWLQEEVRKPAYPRPRGRRVLKYEDPGTEQRTVRDGQYTETFEVAGRARLKASEVKITLPSYQVGIYRDKRFPFRVHTYNGREGFNFHDVVDYYGGAELVPAECKRVYIENDLCYDIRSVVMAIRNEHKQLMAAGRIR